MNVIDTVLSFLFPLIEGHLAAALRKENKPGLKRSWKNKDYGCINLF